MFFNKLCREKTLTVRPVSTATSFKDLYKDTYDRMSSRLVDDPAYVIDYYKALFLIRTCVLSEQLSKVYGRVFAFLSIIMSLAEVSKETDTSSHNSFVFIL